MRALGFLLGNGVLVADGFALLESAPRKRDTSCGRSISWHCSLLGSEGIAFGATFTDLTEIVHVSPDWLRIARGSYAQS